jgi:hypothetical protein
MPSFAKVGRRSLRWEHSTGLRDGRSPPGCALRASPGRSCAAPPRCDRSPPLWRWPPLPPPARHSCLPARSPPPAPLPEQRVDLLDGDPDLRAPGLAADVEEDIGLGQAHLGEERAAQLRVVVLAGVDDEAASSSRRMMWASLMISGRVPNTTAIDLGANPYCWSSVSPRAALALACGAACYEACSAAPKHWFSPWSPGTSDGTRRLAQPASRPTGGTPSPLRVVVPAHDEEPVIGASSATSPPRTPTPRGMGAGGPLRMGPRRSPAAGVEGGRATTGPDGKGPALAWYLDEHPLESDEALVVLDADNRVPLICSPFLR